MDSRTRSSRRARRFKPRGVFNARRGDAGFSLVELMVAIVIFSIIGAIVTTAIVGSSQASRTTTTSVLTQSQLVDAMTHIGRDISAGSLVSAGSTSSLEVRGVQGGQCVVSAFAASGSSLTETRTTLADTTCPATGGTTAPGGTGAPKTLITSLTTTAIFTFFDTSNADITNGITDPTTPESPSDIRRVQYTVTASVSGRNNPMVLTSSATVNSPLHGRDQSSNPNCPAPVLSGALDTTDPTVSHLNWTQPLAATGYILVRDGGTVAEPGDPTVTSFDDSNLSPGTSYLYYVYSQCNADTSAQSNGVLINTPPAPPLLSGQLYALDPDNQANDGKLSWTSVTGASSYQLFRTGPGDNTFASVYSGPGTAYTDKDLTWAKTYQYYVVAIGVGGTSTQSNIVKLTPSISPPAAPSCTASLYANDADGLLNDGKFVWAAVPGATSYSVFGQPNGASAFSTIYSGTALTATYVNKMSYGQQYNFYIIASNQGGDSPASAICSLTPTMSTGNTPPLNLTGSIASLSQKCDLAWKWGVTPDPTFDSSNRYNLYMSTTSATSGFSLVTAQANTSRSYSKTDCPWGGTLYFKVTTNATAGPLVTSNVVKLLVAPGPFSIYYVGVSPAPAANQYLYDSNVSTTSSGADTTGTMQPHWSKSAGATSYTWQFNGVTVAGSPSYTVNSNGLYFYGTPQRVSQGGYIRDFVAVAKAANGLTRSTAALRAQSSPTVPNRVGFIQTCVVDKNANGAAYWGLHWFAQLQPWANASYTGWQPTTLTYHVVVQGYDRNGTANPNSRFVSDAAGDGWVYPRDAYTAVANYVSKGDSSKWVMTLQAKAVRSTPSTYAQIFNPTAYSPVVSVSINSTKTEGWLVNSGYQQDCGSSSYTSGYQYDAPYNQNNFPATWDRGFTRFSHDSWAGGRRIPSDGF